jgi:Ca2+-binding EF-hand superfamily protein
METKSEEEQKIKKIREAFELFGKDSGQIPLVSDWLKK